MWTGSSICLLIYACISHRHETNDGETFHIKSSYGRFWTETMCSRMNVIWRFSLCITHVQWSNVHHLWYCVWSVICVLVNQSWLIWKANVRNTFIVKYQHLLWLRISCSYRRLNCRVTRLIGVTDDPEIRCCCCGTKLAVDYDVTVAWQNISHVKTNCIEEYKSGVYCQTSDWVEEVIILSVSFKSFGNFSQLASNFSQWCCLRSTRLFIMISLITWCGSWW